MDRIQNERPGIRCCAALPLSGRSSEADFQAPSRCVAKGSGETRRAGPSERKSLARYRRKWATERKHLPDVDVAAAGGWKELESLRQCYQQADEATMLEVVLSGGKLRESKG